ncbi:MAG: serine hydrolase domain-containing protein, partial [Candidatus Thorarchaeota archaeon]
MREQRRRFTGLTIVLALIFLALNTVSYAQGSEQIHRNADALIRDYWPTNEWRNATPAEHGVDQSYLEAMMENIEDQDHYIDSVIVVRDGYIIWEKYPSSFSPTLLHMIQSCTKSFTSTLIGVAIQEGFIDNVSQKMLEFFPGRIIDNLDSRKENITLYHMLTMSEGMHWTELEYPYDDERNTLGQMWEATDAIQHILDQPMVRDPGDEWHYNSGMSILLGAVLEEATGQDVESFAEEYLFDKIGIDNYLWHYMPRSGVLHTDGGLFLTARDMARLGYLMLNNGTWDGEQIVSEEWVAEATRAHFDTGWFYGYGYQWWTLPNIGVYTATGHYEQKIYIAPEHDLVVVFTANIADEAPHPTDSLLSSFILPAIISDESSMSGLWT